MKLFNKTRERWWDEARVKMEIEEVEQIYKPA